jgi:dTDP-N-acetylfucosamine:lipid II N-acetylfucosaminyltransferase
MIVHLFEDEKFVDTTIQNFEIVSKERNKYIIFSNNKNLKYISSTDVLVLPNSSYKIDFNLIFDDCELLIIHFLTPLKLYILKNKPSNVKVMWSVWGSDAYDHFKNQFFFEPLSSNISQNNLLKFSKKFWIYTFYHFLKYRVNPICQELVQLKNINYISTVLPDEFQLIQKEFNLEADYVDFNYAVDDFDVFEDFKLGDSVLVGNSATTSNNHLDVFEIIRDVNKNIVVPLNYGAFGYKKYRKWIILEGKRIFKSSFMPIEEFIPLKEYNKLLLSCNSMIMYHIRQQALGNIYMGLFVGMRIFLNRKSVTFQYLNKIGMIVFDLEKDIDLIGTELDNKSKEKNRSLVAKLQSKNVILRKAKGVVNLCN